MRKCLLQSQETIYHLDFESEHCKEKLVLHGDAAKLGIKSVVERNVLAGSGGEINSTRGRGNRQFPLVHPTQLKPPQTVSGCEMRGSS